MPSHTKPCRPVIPGPWRASNPPSTMILTVRRRGRNERAVKLCSDVEILRNVVALELFDRFDALHVLRLGFSTFCHSIRSQHPLFIVWRDHPSPGERLPVTAASGTPSISLLFCFPRCTCIEQTRILDFIQRESRSSFHLQSRTRSVLQGSFTIAR